MVAMNIENAKLVASQISAFMIKKSKKLNISEQTLEL